MANVRCRACGREYNNSENKTCPYCGSLSFYTNDDLERIEQARQADLLEREEAKRKVLEHRNNFIILVIGAMVAVVVFILIICIIITSSIRAGKQRQYDSANALYEQGQYEEAIEKFDKIKNFSDSEQRIKDIQNLLAEYARDYERGTSYYNSGQYGNAISTFEQCKNYLDSNEMINKSAEGLFNEAKSYYDSGSYAKAKEIIILIPEYTSIYNSSVSLISDIDVAVKEQERHGNYDRAVEFYDNEQYDEAQKLFVLAEGYNDSVEYLNTIGESFYNLAQEAYSAKDYALCGEYLEKIDSADEWSSFKTAEDLKKAASDEYIGIVSDEAKKICRSNGDAEMKAYVDSMICSLLSTEAANDIKSASLIKKVSLESIDPYVSEHISHDYDETDTMGNVYPYAIRGYESISYDECYDLYNIKKQYKYLTVTVAAQGTSFGIGDSCIGHARIYGDDKLLWSDDNINKTTKPYDIEVDIEGVEDLRIDAYGDGNMGRHGIFVILGNPMLIE